MTTDLATTSNLDLVEGMAAQYDLTPDDFWNTMQSMCGCQGAERSHFLGLLLQAKKLGLDPVSKQLYLMDTGRGIQVVIPVDGYLRLMRGHPDYLHHNAEDKFDQNGRPYAVTVTIWTKSSVGNNLPPYTHTEYFAECARTTGPWKSHPMRMLRHKAFSQAIRACFAIYMADEDEWARAADVASGQLPERPAGMDGLKALMAEDEPAAESMHGAADGFGGQDPHPDDVTPTEIIPPEEPADDGRVSAPGELFTDDPY